MISIRNFSLLLLTLLCLWGNIGCTPKPAVEGVEPISAEDIREMIRLAEESSLAAETDAAPKTEQASGMQVYWTDSGQVWHTDPDCASLKRSSNVRTGTTAEAETAGKSRICSYCEKE